MHVGCGLHEIFSVIPMTGVPGKELVKQSKLPNNSDIIDLFWAFDEQAVVL